MTEQDIDHDVDTARMLATIGRWAVRGTVIALPFVAIAATVLILFTLFNSIQHLGAVTLAVNPSVADVTALAVTGTLALLLVAGAVLSRLQKRRTLVIAGLCTVLWLALTFLMAVVDTWLTVTAIKGEATLMRVGVFVYSALPALPLIPLAWLWLSATHERDNQYPTMAAAMGAMGLTILKALLTVAMFSMETFYGISIGVNPIAAVFAGTLNAIAFSLALGNAEAAAHDHDHGGIKVWGLVSVSYAMAMFAISAEAIVTFSGGRDGALRAMAAPLWMEQFAQWAFVSSIGLSALLIALTFWRKAHRHAVTTGQPASAQTLGNGKGVHVVRPDGWTRAAGAITGARAGAAKVRGAWRGDEHKALPYPRLAKDVPDRRQSERGVPYDATAQVSVLKIDDSDASERAAYIASIAAMDHDELGSAIDRSTRDPFVDVGDYEKEWEAITARIKQLDPAGDTKTVAFVREIDKAENLPHPKL